MAAREYPPAPLIHRPDCDGIAQGAFPVMATRDIALRHPNGRPHRCYDFLAYDRGAVEPVIYPAHEYVRSTIHYEDARVPLCRRCRGTHGDVQVAGGGLLLASRRPRILLPGEAISGSAGIILPGGR